MSIAPVWQMLSEWSPSLKTKKKSEMAICGAVNWANLMWLTIYLLNVNTLGLMDWLTEGNKKSQCKHWKCSATLHHYHDRQNCHPLFSVSELPPKEALNCNLFLFNFAADCQQREFLPGVCLSVESIFFFFLTQLLMTCKWYAGKTVCRVCVWVRLENESGAFFGAQNNVSGNNHSLNRFGRLFHTFWRVYSGWKASKHRFFCLIPIPILYIFLILYS